MDMCRVEEECDKVADTLRLGVEIIDDIDKNEELVQVGPTKIEWTLQNMANKLACAPARTPRREGRQRGSPGADGQSVYYMWWAAPPYIKTSWSISIWILTGILCTISAKYI